MTWDWEAAETCLCRRLGLFLGCLTVFHLSSKKVSVLLFFTTPHVSGLVTLTVWKKTQRSHTRSDPLNTLHAQQLLLGGKGNAVTEKEVQSPKTWRKKTSTLRGHSFITMMNDTNLKTSYQTFEYLISNKRPMFS